MDTSAPLCSNHRDSFIALPAQLLTCPPPPGQAGHSCKLGPAGCQQQCCQSPPQFALRAVPAQPSVSLSGAAAPRRSSIEGITIIGQGQCQNIGAMRLMQAGATNSSGSPHLHVVKGQSDERAAVQDRSQRLLGGAAVAVRAHRRRPDRPNVGVQLARVLEQAWVIRRRPTAFGSMEVVDGRRRSESAKPLWRRPRTN